VSNTIRLATRLLTVLLTGFLAACTSTSAGEPRPTGSPTPTNGSESESEAASTPTSTRPREIKLDGLDPCTLLPQADYSDYYLDKPGKLGTTTRGEPECFWSGDVGFMGAVLVTYEGVEAQEDKLGKIEPTDPIDDFPAYTIVLPSSDAEICAVVVDVADGQYLDVQVGLDGDRPGVPPVCEYAHQFATSIMSTLVAS